MKVLVTGAAGAVGINVIKHLSKRKEILVTAVDLSCRKNIKKLKAYEDKIKIIYGDITDEVFMKDLIRNHDAIIHLAGILPPFADVKGNLSRVIDYEGCKSLINLIIEYNPSCFFIFASATSLYGAREENHNLTIKDKIVLDPDDAFAMIKLRCEEKIQENLKNYTIFRLPAVLGDLKHDSTMYHIPKNSKVEFITANDAGLAFANAIDNKRKINKKIFNVSGGENCRINSNEFIRKILMIYGLSFDYISSSILIDKNFYGGYYEDGDKINKILNFRTESLDDYFNCVKSKFGKKRLLPRLLAKPLLGFKK